MEILFNTAERDETLKIVVQLSWWWWWYILLSHLEHVDERFGKGIQCKLHLVEDSMKHQTFGRNAGTITHRESNTSSDQSVRGNIMQADLQK